MIDINLLRKDPELVRENIRKKFQDKKLPLVDEVLSLDSRRRELQKEGDERRAKRNSLSAEIGKLMREKKTDEANAVKAEVVRNNERIAEIEKETEEISEKLKKDMMSIPNIIADDVPIGKDDSENVERQRFLEPAEKPFEVPYHLDILEKLGGVDIDRGRRTSGQGFFYLVGGNAPLYSAVVSFSPEFMVY